MEEEWLKNLPDELVDIWELNNTISQLIDAEEWDQITHLTAQRQSLLESFFLSWDRQGDIEIMIDYIKRLHACIDKQTHQIQSCRNQSMKNVLDFKKSFSATRTYEDISRRKA